MNVVTATGRIYIARSPWVWRHLQLQTSSLLLCCFWPYDHMLGIGSLSCKGLFHSAEDYICLSLAQIWFSLEIWCRSVHNFSVILYTDAQTVNSCITFSIVECKRGRLCELQCALWCHYDICIYIVFIMLHKVVYLLEVHRWLDY